MREVCVFMINMQVYVHAELDHFRGILFTLTQNLDRQCYTYGVASDFTNRKKKNLVGQDFWTQ